jgi:dTDP-4-amino-4,6-dideoxygalactose transaminase
VTILDEIPIQRPRLPAFKDIEARLKTIDLSRTYSNHGPLVRELEAQIADYLDLDAKNVVCLSSGTMALEGALVTSACEDNVWQVPSWTFTATAGALLRSQSKAEFRDVDDEWRVVPGEEVACLLDVLPFGLGLRRTFPQANVILIDGASAFDALRSVRLPTSTRAGCVISLHATKVPASGEGGVFFSNDEDWVAAVRRWANFGMVGSRVSQVCGANGKMSEYHAAVGLAAIECWESTRMAWLQQIDRALSLSDEFGLKVQESMRNRIVSPYWILELEDENRTNELRRLALDRSIQTRRWWERGCHSMPAYASVPIGDSLTKTTRLAVSTLGLPLFIDMDERQWARIRALLSDFSV